MKKILICFCMCIVVSTGLNAQNSAASLADQVAQKIAQKMKDSLSLSPHQQDQIYHINLQLNSQKMAARKQYTDISSLRAGFQQIENTRDSLYHSVLNDDKYRLYKQKKRNLVNNN